MVLWREARPGTRRAARQKELLRLRLAGRYGPSWWAVAPAVLGLGLAGGLLVSMLVWAWTWWGGAGLVTAVMVLMSLSAAVIRRHRTVRRHQRGIYTPAELESMEECALLEAVGRVLRREGWLVSTASWQGRPRLICRRGGAVLDVVVRQAAVRPGDTSADPPLRAARTPGGGGDVTHLLVSRGTYSRADILWASRQGVHLIDGRTLQSWTSGYPVHID